MMDTTSYLEGLIDVAKKPSELIEIQLSITNRINTMVNSLHIYEKSCLLRKTNNPFEAFERRMEIKDKTTESNDKKVVRGEGAVGVTRLPPIVVSKLRDEKSESIDKKDKNKVNATTTTTTTTKTKDVTPKIPQVTIKEEEEEEEEEEEIPNGKNDEVSNNNNATTEDLIYTPPKEEVKDDSGTLTSKSSYKDSVSTAITTSEPKLVSTQQPTVDQQQPQPQKQLQPLLLSRQIAPKPPPPAAAFGKISKVKPLNPENEPQWLTPRLQHMRLEPQDQRLAPPTHRLAGESIQFNPEAPMAKYYSCNLANKFMPYQASTVDWLIRCRKDKSTTKGRVLGFQQGLGKTMTALGVFFYNDDPETAKLPTLIVCELSNISTWCKEFVNSVGSDAHGDLKIFSPNLQLAFVKKKPILTAHRSKVATPSSPSKPLVPATNLGKGAASTSPFYAIYNNTNNKGRPKKEKKTTAVESWKGFSTRKYNIAIVNYQNVLAVFNKDRHNSPLFKTEWGMVVLDEGQYIKGGGKNAAAINDLKRKFGIISSGTLYNNLFGHDYHAYFRFMGYESAVKMEKAAWSRMVEKNQAFRQKCQTDLRNLSIRHTMDSVRKDFGVGVPEEERYIYVHPFLTNVEAEFYKMASEQTEANIDKSKANFLVNQSNWWSQEDLESRLEEAMSSSESIKKNAVPSLVRDWKGNALPHPPVPKFQLKYAPLVPVVASASYSTSKTLAFNKKGKESEEKTMAIMAALARLRQMCISYCLSKKTRKERSMAAKAKRLKSSSSYSSNYEDYGYEEGDDDDEDEDEEDEEDEENVDYNEEDDYEIDDIEDDDDGVILFDDDETEIGGINTNNNKASSRQQKNLNDKKRTASMKDRSKKASWLNVPETLYGQITTVESTKMKMLKTLILNELGPGEKMLIFSFWTSALDVAEEMLRRAQKRREFPVEKDHLNKFTWTRLDGKMKPEERQESERIFIEDPNCQIYFISIKAGGKGLNLPMAKYVVLMEPWFNPQVEEQAIYRAVRINTTHIVKVFHMLIEGTIEEEVYRMARLKLIAADEVENKGEITENAVKKKKMAKVFTPENILRMLRSRKTFLNALQPTNETAMSSFVPGVYKITKQGKFGSAGKDFIKTLSRNTSFSSTASFSSTREFGNIDTATKTPVGRPLLDHLPLNASSRPEENQEYDEEMTDDNNDTAEPKVGTTKTTAATVIIDDEFMTEEEYKLDVQPLKIKVQYITPHNLKAKYPTEVRLAKFCTHNHVAWKTVHASVGAPDTWTIFTAHNTSGALVRHREHHMVYDGTYLKSRSFDTNRQEDGYHVICSYIFVDHLLKLDSDRAAPRNQGSSHATASKIIDYLVSDRNGFTAWFKRRYRTSLLNSGSDNNNNNNNNNKDGNNSNSIKTGLSLVCVYQPLVDPIVLIGMIASRSKVKTGEGVDRDLPMLMKVKLEAKEYVLIFVPTNGCLEKIKLNS